MGPGLWVVALLADGLLLQAAASNETVSVKNETCFLFSDLDTSECPTCYAAAQSNATLDHPPLDCAPALPPCPLKLGCVPPSNGTEISAQHSLEGIYCTCQDGHPVMVRCPKLGWLPWEKLQMKFNATSAQCVS